MGGFNIEVLAFLVIAFLVVGLQSWLFARFVPHNLEYKCEFSTSEAHEGDELFLVETVHNRKLLPVPWLKVDIHTSRWLDFAGARSVITQDNRRVTSTFLLKAFQRITRRWKLKCLKRGVFTIENVTLVWGDLLGFKTGSIPVGVGSGLVVYPEIINLEEMFISVNYLQGDTLVKRWIIDDPFVVSGAREYTPRDSMNRIHWNATAGSGRLMVKKNDFTSQLSLTIILNMQSMEFEYNNVINRDNIELGIKAAATLLDRALRNGCPVRLAANGVMFDKEGQMICTPLASGRAHISGLLEILARLELRSIKYFENFLEDMDENMENNDIIILTSYVNPDICRIARGFRRRNNSVKLVVLDKYANMQGLPGDLDIYMLSEAGERYEGNQ